MTTHTSVIFSETVSNITTWSSGPLDVSAYDEIAYDINSSSPYPNGQWRISRLDPFNVPFQIQGNDLFIGGGTGSIGPSQSFDTTRALGNSIQLDLVNGDGTAAAVIWIEGKSYK